jgi:S1-C subfamily serine protease
MKGVLIMAVQPGSPAEKAGLQPTHRNQQGNIQLGDLIVAIDGRKVESGNQLLDIFEGREAGDSVVVTVSRDGKQRQVTVILEPIT